MAQEMYCMYSYCVSCIKEERCHCTTRFLSLPYTFSEKDRVWANGCTCHLLQRVFLHLVTTSPSPIVKRAPAGSSPLICSRAAIIGPLRPQKDTQHVAEIESNTLPRERTSNSLATLVMTYLPCLEICVGTSC